jgi:uncharacterized protein (UPF0261 family)
MKKICMIGAFDTKGAEYAYLRQCILARGQEVLTVNTGVLGSTDLFAVDVEAGEVAAAGGASLEQLRADKDRGRAMKVMCAGAPVIVESLHEAGKIDGIIGMGGTGGTTVVTAAMRALPIGIPKVCVSTAASGDVSAYIGTKDITMIPSIVDVAGINRISRIFHATGTGGKTMEDLVRQGLVDAVLDITTTEWADTVCGGVFDAGAERLDAPGKMGIPHLIVPGCVDMANFGGLDTVPDRYRKAKRTFYEWNPSITLMRTNRQENERMGRIFSQKANAANGPVAFLIPLKGVSILDGDGQPFCDRDADKAMFDAIKANLKEGIAVVEMNNNINDSDFSEKAVEMMLDLIEQAKRHTLQGSKFPRAEP